MGEEVADGDLRFDVAEARAEIRQVAGHRRIEVENTLLHERECGGRSDGLGGGGEEEDGIGRHRPAGLAVGVAVRGKVDRLAMPRHHRDRADDDVSGYRFGNRGVEVRGDVLAARHATVPVSSRRARLPPKTSGRSSVAKGPWRSR